MAMSHGMDVGEVRRLGGSLQTSAGSIDDLIKRIGSAVSGSTWVGPDSTMFKTQWWPEHRAHLKAMSETLYGLGQSALRNATEQEQASGPSGSSDTSSERYGIRSDRMTALRLEAGGLESPQAARDWWNSLTETERSALIASDSNLIGNLDGIPPKSRYEANRNNIQAHVDGLQAARAELAAKIASPLEALADISANNGQFHAQLGALDAKIERFESLSSETNRILIFDPTGDGRIAQVFGDLSTVSRISVVLPGIGNDADGFSADDASRLYDSLGREDGGTATIQWLGYDTPPGALDPDSFADWSALNPTRAQESAGDLVSFVEGIRVGSGAEVTVVAHSYGTVVAAEAAKAGMVVDKVVLLGSPGIPADDMSVFNGASVYAIANGVDLIAESGVHGTNPVDPEFGATVLGGNSFGHSTYFDSGSQSLDRIAGVVGGRYALSDGTFQSVRVEDGVVVKTRIASY